MTFATKDLKEDSNAMVHKGRARVMRIMQAVKAGIVLFIAGSLCAAETIPGTTATNNRSSNAAVIADLTADAATDLDAMRKYASATRQLLYEGQFDRLETIAQSDRATKSKFSGGVWKLYTFYQGIKEPAEGGRFASNESWQKHLSAIASWVAAKPDSVTARVAFAEAFVSYTGKLLQDAESQRAQSTQVDYWPQIRSAQHATELLLKDISGFTTKCPHYYFVSLEVQERSGRDNAAKLFEEAIAFEPTYTPFYRLHSIFQRSEWSDGQGDAAKFADDIANRIGGKQGAAMYFEIATALNAGPDTRRLQLVVLPWDRVRDGYAAAAELYGSSLVKLNQMAYLAMRYGDTAMADQLFRQIGDRRDPGVWKNAQYFEFSKTYAAAPPEVASIRAKAKDNMLSPDGRKYMGQFVQQIRSQFASALTKCAGKMSNGPRSGNDIYIRVAADGTVQETNSWPKTDFCACVIPSLANAKLPPPPFPSYWVGLMQPPSDALE